MLDGKVIGRDMQRPRHQDFVRFLGAVERAVPAGKSIHAVLDNYAAHKHRKVRAWLDRHPRWKPQVRSMFHISRPPGCHTADARARGP